MQFLTEAERFTHNHARSLKEVVTYASGTIEYELAYDEKSRTTYSSDSNGTVRNSFYVDEAGVGLGTDADGEITTLMELDENGRIIAMWSYNSGRVVYSLHTLNENGKIVRSTQQFGPMDEAQWTADVEILKSLVDVDAVIAG